MVKNLYSRVALVVMLLLGVFGGVNCKASTDILEAGYKPAGDRFEKSVTIDWTSQKIVAQIDLSTCTGTSENVMSVTTNKYNSSEINENRWCPTNGFAFHFYYTKSSSNVSLYFLGDNGGSGYRINKTLTKTGTVTVEISRWNGVVVDNEQVFTPAQMTDAQLKADIFKTGSFYFSSEEGSNRSNATYKSTQIVDLDKITLSSTTTETDLLKQDWGKDKNSGETYKPNNTLFSETHAYDLSSGVNFKAVLDLSSCESSSTYTNILSVGYNDISQWQGSGVYAIHFYYARSTKNLRIQTLVGTTRLNQGTDFEGASFSADLLTILISKDGLYVNGTQKLTAAQVAQVFVGSTLTYGSVEGHNSTATYKDFSFFKTEEETVDRVFDETNPVFNPKAKTGAKVMVVRTLGAGYWNTLCLPFSMTSEQVKATFGEGVQLRKYGSMEGTTMNFEAADAIVAGDPYLIKVEENVVDPVVENVEVTANNPVEKGNGTYGMKGTYTSYALATNGSNLFLGNGDKFYIPGTSTNTMKGLRAYFIAPVGTNPQALMANINGEVTAIADIEKADEDCCSDAPVYNLQGQFVGTNLKNLPSGLYIKDGKKIVVK